MTKEIFQFRESKRKTRLITSDIANGRTQYPKTQTHWKKEMQPPRSFELTVTTIDPIQKIMKISANSGYEASVEDEAEDCVPCIRRAISTQIRRGPHRSQSLKSSCLDCMGKNICLNLTPMALASRRKVSLMGSSKVEESSVFRFTGALISPSRSSSCNIAPLELLVSSVGRLWKDAAAMNAA